MLNDSRTPYSIAWTQSTNIFSDRNGSECPYHGLFGSRPDFEKFGMSALHVAVLGWDSASVDAAVAATPRSFINEQDLQGRTALSYAAQSESIRIIRKLLLKGADPKIEDNLGWRPLHYLTLNSLEDESDWDEMLYLLGCDDGINHRDYYGMNVLHHACWSGLVTPAGVAKLVTFGVDIKSRDLSGFNALHCVIKRDTESGLDVANWLLDNDADTRTQDILSRTPVMLALVLGRNQFLELLLARGADYTLPMQHSRNVLHAAAGRGNLESLCVLQQAGIALQLPNAEDTYGCSPMEIAQWRRDHNTEWSDGLFRAPDENPQKFFDAFEALLHSVEQRSAAMDWTTSSDPVSAIDAEEEADRHLPGSFPDD